MTGTLFVIATPLGHPGDLSPRAKETLAGLDVLLAEDTRTAAQLLASIGAGVPVRSCFDANEQARAQEALTWLAEGKNVGLVSEAGTPGISDPGWRIIRAAVDAGARVVPIPGPAAFVAALVASGLPTDRFFFLGFPPRKEGPRRELFASLRTLPATLVLYESPLRVAETLTDLAATLGDRPACLARELTKPHEEIVRESLAGLAARYAVRRPLGEVTLVVGGPMEDQAPLDEAELAARAAALLATGLSPRDAAARLALDTGLPKREAYRVVLTVAAERSGST